MVIGLTIFVAIFVVFLIETIVNLLVWKRPFPSAKYKLRKTLQEAKSSMIRDGSSPESLRWVDIVIETVKKEE